MDWTLEVVVVPVGDIDRAIASTVTASASIWTMARGPVISVSLSSLRPAQGARSC